jgi:hypothetical protein
MALRTSIVALGMIAAMSPASASQPNRIGDQGAPPAPPDARYCLRVEPVIGSRMETTQCRTREDWARLEVDVDQEWAGNGVRVIA